MIYRLFGFLLLILFLATPARAYETSWQKTDQTAVRVIAGQYGGDEQGNIDLGLQFQMIPHWKIYWRFAGDAGYGPEINWQESSNIQSIDMAWPVPKQFSFAGLDTYGYEDEVVLPLRVQLQDPTQDGVLRLHVDYLTCEELCIPYKADLVLPIAAQTPTPTPHADLIESYQKQVPVQGNGLGMTIEKAVMQGDRLYVTTHAAFSLREPDMLVESSKGLVFAKQKVTLMNNDHRAEFVFAHKGMEKISPHEMIFTFMANTRAIEVRMVPHMMMDPALLKMILLALLGGLILNLMPCVLPVLSLKFLHVVKSAGKERTQIRLQFLMSALGILVSFLILAGGLILLKSAGHQIGWGIQFQHPGFLVFLILVLLFFSFYLFGFYELRLPQFLTGMGADSMRDGMWGHFFTGMLATLLATPCSAPFLGTAVGFALAQGSTEILIIFTALGVGLAVPYFLVAAFPEVVRIMPKPGKWMVWVKYILGAALLITASWLMMIYAGLKFDQQASILSWQKFEPEKIQSLVENGNIVLVDVTADWCLTCQANKKFVLENEEIVALLQEENIILMQGDWTHPDEKISDYLQSFGRYGIPFNVVYSPILPQGDVLSELLSVDAVYSSISFAIAARAN